MPFRQSFLTSREHFVENKFSCRIKFISLLFYRALGQPLWMATHVGMVQAWVGQKLLKFLRCPIFALGPRFHKNPDILEVIHYNVKLLYYRIDRGIRDS